MDCNHEQLVNSVQLLFMVCLKAATATLQGSDNGRFSWFLDSLFEVSTEIIVDVKTLVNYISKVCDLLAVFGW